MFTHRWQSRRNYVISFAVLVVSLNLGASGASAEPKPVQHCITPTAVDLNERYDVSAMIVAPFCNQLSSGRHWTVSNAWFMSYEFESVPDGFEPAGDTPAADFIAKFTGIKYVIDPGTPRQKIHFFASDDELGIFDDGIGIIANSVTVGLLQPLSVGDHVVVSYFVLNGLHCDGYLGGTVEDNCLPAGETFFSSVSFAVTPGH